MQRENEITVVDVLKKQKNKLAIAILFSSLTKRVYRSVDISLNQKQTSFVMVSITTIIFWIQLTLVLFNNEFYTLWRNDGMASIGNLISRYFHIASFLKSYGVISSTILSLLFTFAIMLAIIFFFWTQKLADSKNMNQNFVKGLNKIFLLVMPSIFFIPYIDCYFSFFDCFQKNGFLVMRIHEDVLCFQGIHLLGFFSSIFGLLLFLMYSFVAAILYIDTKADSRLPFTMYPTYTLFLLQIYSLCNMIIIHYLAKYVFDYVFTIYNLLWSIYFAYIFFIDRPIYNRFISKLWASGAVFLCWTSAMLLLSQVFEGELFHGSFILWISCGILFIAVVMLIEEKKNTLLLTSNKKIYYSKKALEQLRHLIKLWTWMQSDEYIASLIDGFLELHAAACVVPECPVHKKECKNNKNDPEFKFIYRKQSKEDYLNLIDIYFKQALRKYESDIRFRLLYIFFLVDHFDDKKAAIKEIEAALKLAPNFQQKFMINRYKRILQNIENRPSIEKNNHEGLYAHNEIAFQHASENLISAIEYVCITYIELWSHLVEEKPQISKIYEICTDLYFGKKKVKEFWNKLKELFPESKAQIIIIYGRYLLTVTYEIDEGEELIHQAKNIINNELVNKADINHFFADTTASEFSIATIVISGEERELGIMTDVNAQACAIFGYTKSEVLGKNVRMLMHRSIAVHHNRYLQRALHNRSLDYFVKERSQFGLNRSGYIVPIKLNIKQVQGHKISYVANIRVEKEITLSAYFLVNSNGKVIGISLGCVSLFGIDLKLLDQYKMLDDYFPNLFDDKDKYIDNPETELHSKYLKNSLITIDRPFSIEIKEQSLTNISRNQYIFIFRPNNFSNKETFKVEKFKRISYFQFVFSKKSQIVKASDNREIEDDSQSLINYPRSRNKNGNRYNHNIKKEFIRLDYGEGVKTLRLENGRTIEIQDEHSDDEIKTNKKHKNHKTIKGEEEEEDSQFKNEPSISKLSKKIDKKPLPKFYKIYLIVFNILAFIILGIIILDYIMKARILTDVNKYFDFLKIYTNQRAKLQGMTSYINELVLQQHINVSYLEKNTLEKLNEALKDNENLEKTILNVAMDLKKSDKVQTLLNEEIKIQTGPNSGSEVVSSLSESIRLLLTKTFAFSQLQLNRMKVTDSNYLYVMRNSLNSIWVGMKNASKEVMQLAFNDMEESTVFYILFSVVLTLGIILLIFTIAQIYKTTKLTKKVLHYFLEIQNDDIYNYLYKNEVFLQKLKNEDYENIHIEEDDDKGVFQENEDDNGYGRKRRKRFNGKFRFSISIVAVYIFSIAVIGIIMITSSYQFKHNINQMKALKEEFNITASLSTEYFFVTNAIFNYILDTNNMLINNEDRSAFMQNTAQVLYSLLSDFNYNVLNNANNHSQRYNDLANLVMNENLCELSNDSEFMKNHNLETKELKENCENIENYLAFEYAKDGISTTLAKYQEQIRDFITLYLRFEQSSFTDEDSKIALGCKDMTDNNSYCALESSYARNIYHYKEYIFKSFSEFITSQLYIDITEYFIPLTSNIQIGFMFGAIGILLLTYIFLGLKFINNEEEKIRIANYMLTLIPFESVRKSKMLRDKLKEEIVSKY